MDMSFTRVIHDNVEKELKEYFTHYCSDMPKTGIGVTVTAENYDPVEQKNGDFIVIRLSYKKYTYLKRYNLEDILFKGQYISLHELFDNFYYFLVKKALWEFTKDVNGNVEEVKEGGEN